MSKRTRQFVVVVMFLGLVSVCSSVRADFLGAGEFSPDANTIILWHLNEGSGTVADNAAISNGDGDGSVTNTSAPEPRWNSAGRFGAGMESQDDVEGYLTGGLYGKSIASVFTFDGWFKPSTNHDPDSDASYLAGISNGFFLRSVNVGSNTRFDFSVNNGSGSWDSNLSYTMPTADYVDGNWHHIAVVYEGPGQAMHIYFDNQEKAVGTAAADAAPLNRPLIVGGAVPWSPNNLNYEYIGQFDEIRLSDTARDNFVPEPATIGLLTIGTLGFIRRK